MDALVGAMSNGSHRAYMAALEQRKRNYPMRVWFCKLRSETNQNTQKRIQTRCGDTRPSTDSFQNCAKTTHWRPKPFYNEWACLEFGACKFISLRLARAPVFIFKRGERPPSLWGYQTRIQRVTLQNCHDKSATGRVDRR